MSKGTNLTEERTWDEFRSIGLLWWINRTLHLFGWALIFEYDGGKFQRCYPARVKFRGFPEASEEKQFKSLTEYLKDTAPDLMEDITDE